MIAISVGWQLSGRGFLRFTTEDFMWDVSGPIYVFSVPSTVTKTSAVLYTDAVSSGEPSLSLPFT